MSGWTKARDRILEKQKAGTRVLVVEGEDDMLFIQALLDKRAPGVWPAQWTLGFAEGKTKIPSILAAQPDWFALVDRDEWTVAEIANVQAKYPGRLHVLPRYCMESYFVIPAEIWAAIPAQQGAVQGGFNALEAAVLSRLPEWLRHGCLWHAVNPLQSGLRALGFKDSLLDFAHAQDDAFIRQTLQAWHQFLEPTEIEASFQKNLTTARAASTVEQLISWVHGKKFFEQHVVPSLNALLGQHDSGKWLTEMRKDLPVPQDLVFLWAAMGL